MGVSVTLPTLIYDGDCGVCQQAVLWLARRGGARTLTFRPYQEQPAEMTVAGLTAAECSCAAYVVEPHTPRPRTYRGAGAMSYALRSLPGRRNRGWRFLGHLYYVPIVKQIEDVGYAWFARNRHRFGNTCRLPG